MKRLVTVLFSAALLNAGAVFAEEGHHHGPIPGPKGGKVFEAEPLHAEFLVNPDRTVTITFYDEAMKPVAPDAQTATVIAEAPAGKTKLELAVRDGALASSEPLPDGEGYRVVVQIRATPDAKPQNFRIDLITAICGECKLPEYACTCENAGEGGHEGHGH